MSRKLLGLDIRGDSLTAVLVNSGVKGYFLETWEHVSWLEGQSEASALADLRSAIATVLSDMDFSGADCVVALPGNRISYRNMQLPFKGAKKIRQVLPFEMEPELPVPIEELVFDFQELKTGGEGADTQILAMAAPLPQVGEILSALATHRIDPEIITAGGFPMTLCLLKFSDLPDIFVFLDIDVKGCSFFLVHNGEILNARSFALDSNPDTRNENMLLQVYRTLLSLEEKNQSLASPKIILASGRGISIGAECQNPGEISQRILGIPFRAINLLEEESIRLDRTLKPIPPSVDLGPAIAAALVENERLTCPNFRTGPFAPMRQWEEHKSSLIKAGVMAFLLLLFYSINLVVNIYARDEKSTRLDEQIAAVFNATFPDEKMSAQPLKHMQEAIRAKQTTTLFPAATEQSVRVIDILDEMSRRIPAIIDVELLRLVIDVDHFVVTGNTDTFNSVDEIQGKLESAALFKKVEIMNTGRSGSRIQFRLKVIFK